jgi:hypothetical protein
MPAEKRLANFLGFFSLGLGVPQVVMPGRVARMIGVRDDRDARMWMRVVGVREHAAAVGILTRRRPAGWLAARVAGDAMDLTLLTIARVRDDRAGRSWRLGRAREEQDRHRIDMAIGAVGGVLALDALAAVAQARRRSDTSENGSAVKAAITVSGDPEQVQRSWLDMHGDDGIGMVRFVPAPGARGTEVHVEADSDMEGLKAELRRFKQLLETGSEVRS